MSLARFVKWSWVCLVVGLVAVVTASYVIARDHARLPPSHPWPAITLLGGGGMMGFIGFRNQSRTILLLRIGAMVLLMMGAALYMWSAL